MRADRLKDTTLPLRIRAPQASRQPPPPVSRLVASPGYLESHRFPPHCEPPLFSDMNSVAQARDPWVQFAPVAPKQIDRRAF
jgi:hypothetical protein